jgi:hypothetical protein
MQGLSDIMPTSLVMKGAMRAGGTTSAGRGEESSAMHAGIY